MALRLRGATSGYIELKAPASAGDNTLTLPTNNGGANQLLKIDGSGNLSWQSNLTFDGSTLTVTGAVGISTALFHIGDDDTKIDFTDNQIDLRTGNLSRIYLNNYALYVRSGFPFAFLATSGDSPNIKSGGTNAQDLLLTTGSGNPTRLQVGVGGDVTVNTGNLVIGTAGKGIDFSAQTPTAATGATTGDEVLDHYEEGTFTPYIDREFGNSPILGYDAQDGYYTRIGRVVHFYIEIRVNAYNGNGSYGTTFLRGLPFTAAARTGGRGGWDSVTLHTYNTGITTTDGEVDIAVVGANTEKVELYIMRNEDTWTDIPAPDANDQYKVGGYYFV